jgi:hypothetical protein
MCYLQLGSVTKVSNHHTELSYTSFGDLKSNKKPKFSRPITESDQLVHFYSTKGIIVDVIKLTKFSVVI